MSQLLRYHNITFGEALEALKQGLRVARAGWNGKGMWLCMVPGIANAGPDQVFGPQIPLAIRNGNQGVRVNPRIDMKAADGSIVVGWLASQTDMLSNDWEVIDGDIL